MNSRGPFRFVRLDFTPFSVAVAREAVGALAGLSGQPRIVLEARGENGAVNWYLGGEEASARRALAAMAPHVPGLRRDAGKRAGSSTAAVAVRFPGHKQASLNTDAAEVAARGVLGALAAAGKGEQVRLQVILGPRLRPRTMQDVPAAVRSKVAAKYGEHRFSCEVRIGAKADDPDRSRRLVQNVAAALRVLEAPGVALRLKRSSLRALDEVRDPFFWPNELNVSEVAAILGWPVASKDIKLPGVRPAHPKVLPVDLMVPNKGIVLGTSPLDSARAVAYSAEDATRHTAIVGPNGVGKSVLTTSLALQHIDAGRALLCIDAKGDTVADIAVRVPEDRLGDLVIIDPTDEAPVGVQTFAGDPERDADVIYGVFRDLHGDALGPRSSDLLHAALLTLARAGGCSLSMLPMLFSNAQFRRRVVAPVAAADPLGLGAKWSWFEHVSDAERVQITAPLRNKIDPLLSLRPGLRAMFGQTSGAFSFRDLFMHPTKRPIVLVNTSSSTLGPAGSQVLGAVLLALAWEAAKERGTLPAKQRHIVPVLVDEAQEVVKLGDLGSALAMARGYGLAFGLINQAMSQYSPAMREAVLANARNRVYFQLSPKDARDIAVTTGGVLDARDFQELPAYHAYASLLVDNNRAPWCSLVTSPPSAPLRDLAVARARSRERYRRPIADVEAELLAVAGYGQVPADDGATPGRITRNRGQS